MKPLRSRAVKQSALSSPLRILAVADGGTAQEMSRSTASRLRRSVGHAEPAEGPDQGLKQETRKACLSASSAVRQSFNPIHYERPVLKKANVRTVPNGDSRGKWKRPFVRNAEN
ncbi:MAG: hypothetical protein Q8O52_28290 [Sulfuritalea sp.]|nr:hypothetical protein [Sulfuritalea sp.]